MIFFSFVLGGINKNNNKLKFIDPSYFMSVNVGIIIFQGKWKFFIENNNITWNIKVEFKKRISFDFYKIFLLYNWELNLIYYIIFGLNFHKNNHNTSITKI